MNIIRKREKMFYLENKNILKERLLIVKTRQIFKIPIMFKGYCISFSSRRSSFHSKYQNNIFFLFSILFSQKLFPFIFKSGILMSFDHWNIQDKVSSNIEKVFIMKWII
jgi:hypothetical protein